MIGYVADHFRKPQPFDPDVVLDVTDVEERKLDALHCHESQMYEWLPFTTGDLDSVPEGDAERRAWLANGGVKHLVNATEMNVANRYPEALEARYGKEAAAVEHAEAVEISEYGATPSEAELDQLFFF